MKVTHEGNNMKVELAASASASAAAGAAIAGCVFGIAWMWSQLLLLLLLPASASGVLVLLQVGFPPGDSVSEAARRCHTFRQFERRQIVHVERK